jgi:SAM-dependent methyltransferase
MNNKDRQPDEPYCSLRVDNEERWSFIQQYLEDHHRSALDIGCAEGYFTNAAAEYGLEVTGIEMDEDRYRHAEAKSGANENCQFRLQRLTPENVSKLPATDITFLLTIQHHWVGAYGIEEATRMLKVIGQKTSLLFYEPPGTMYLSKADPIHPDESISKYRTYLLNLFDGAATIQDVELFDHVNEGEYTDRRDPLFVIDTTDI